MKIQGKHNLAIAALLAGLSHAEAAAASRVSVKTLRRWLSDPAFKAALTGARNRLLDESLDRLQALTCEAVETLRASLQAEKAADRIRAAVALLDHAMRARELRDLGQEIEELKQAVKRQGSVTNNGATYGVRHDPP